MWFFHNSIRFKVTKVGYNVDFEDVTIGTKTEDAITGDGIKGVVLRGHKKAVKVLSVGLP